jgi:hypothetical protein
MNNWLPVKWHDDENLLQWMRFDEQPFAEPFFDETLMRIRAAFPENRGRVRSTTSLHLLSEHAASAAPPDLLIFHTSRCGSTLLAQLLGLDPETAVLAEVPLLDQLLAAGACPELRAAAHLLRRGKQKLVIKTDCWHLLHYETLRSIWPGVPAVALYRRPAEILRSLRKQPGMQAVPGMLSAKQLPGVNPQQHPNDFFGELMCTFFSKLQELRTTAPDLLQINYTEGALQMASKTIAHAGFTLTPIQHEKIEKRARYNAKHPNIVFSEHQNEISVPEYLIDAELLYGQLISL